MSEGNPTEGSAKPSGMKELILGGARAGQRA